MDRDQILRVSEIFESAQGEGASAGTPSLFLRLATCNLRCAWCDTKYTWDWAAYRYDDEVREADVTELAPRILSSVDRHLVITGGEPLLQARALESLLLLLPETLYVEVETNGTLAPSAGLAKRVNQWNVSPKLANSGELEHRRLRPEALTALLETGAAWLKLVVKSGEESAEIAALLESTEWPRARVLLMPEAATRSALAERMPLVQRLAATFGVGVSPRLHVERWDGRRGV
jgi:organic radical activating enzyme